MAYTVGEAARLAHVSVRTLHHYDEIGLVTPSERSGAGYRLYASGDLERLQQVLLYKEIGFGLAEIRTLMADRHFDRRQALLMQRNLIAEQALRLRAVLDLMDRTLANLDGGIPMSDEEMFAVFGDFDPREYADETRERWGHTHAYQASARRTKQYTKADWQRFKDESEEINTAIARLMDAGVPPEDARAMDAVERHRLQIDQWFYPCSRDMHAELGKMYVADPRFTATYAKIRPGMAEYVRKATAANARRSQS